MYTLCVTGQHTQLDLSHFWLSNTEIFIVFLILILLIFFLLISFLLIFALYISVRRPSGRPFRAIYPSEQEDPVSYDPYGLSVWAGFSWGTYCTYISIPLPLPLPLPLWDDSIVALKKISIFFSPFWFLFCTCIIYLPVYINHYLYVIFFVCLLIIYFIIFVVYLIYSFLSTILYFIFYLFLS